MKKTVSKTPEAEILKTYPHRGKTEGWYFRVEEISNGAYVVEGTDQWGRLVSRQGSNSEELMAQCELDAQRINDRIKGVS